MSLLVTGFSTVEDVRKTLTPDFKQAGSALLLLDLGEGKNRMGASCLAQCFDQVGDTAPDLDNPELFKQFFACIQSLIAKNLILSYHDRSDGGLYVTVTEMAIAGRKGYELNLDALLNSDCSDSSTFETLFNEELGAVLEIDSERLAEVESTIESFGLNTICHAIGKTTSEKSGRILQQSEIIYENTITELNRVWSELSYTMQSLRDNSDCAQEAYDLLLDETDQGIIIQPTFDPDKVPNISKSEQPKIAIFREQGINGQNEMAYAFDKAGFKSVDVHMTDLLEGRFQLNEFQALVACGGFSYGDVLGAGSGWAKCILYNASIKEQFERFFADSNTIALGVCNGCQMLSQLKSIIPGADPWPYFVRNKSEQFEARLSNISVLKSPSVFLQGMEDSLLPIPVAHGEGRTDFSSTGNLEQCLKDNLVGMRYIDSKAQPSEVYPINPNGSEQGNTCFTTPDGRVTIMMPHPERCFRSVQMSYGYNHFKGENGPWMRLFENARSVF